MNPLKWRIISGGKSYPINDLAGLAIHTGDCLWIYDPKKSDMEKELRFVRAWPGWQSRSGNLWREFRKRIFGTQAVAAKALGLSQSFLAKVEKGEREIPLKAWCKWMDEQDKWKDFDKLFPGVWKESPPGSGGSSQE